MSITTRTTTTTTTSPLSSSLLSSSPSRPSRPSAASSSHSESLIHALSQNPRLGVHPLRWSQEHLVHLDCHFITDSHPPNDTDHAGTLQDLGSTLFDSTVSISAKQKKVVWAMNKYGLALMRDELVLEFSAISGPIDLPGAEIFGLKAVEDSDSNPSYISLPCLAYLDPEAILPKEPPRMKRLKPPRATKKTPPISHRHPYIMALLIGLAQKAHGIAATYHVQPPKSYHVLLLGDDDEDNGGGFESDVDAGAARQRNTDKKTEMRKKNGNKSLRLYSASIASKFLAKIGTPHRRIGVNSSHKPTSGSIPARPETRGMGDEDVASGSAELIAREYRYRCPQEAGRFQIALDRIKGGGDDYTDGGGGGDVGGGEDTKHSTHRCVGVYSKRKRQMGYEDQQQEIPIKTQKNWG
ncbi:hypothetical protein DL766_010023 [Monosporascus sp. MC13-8B]|uniref:Uncharacterized protein n=1 Tax=Monosporascus cannonballus TaxID=155416 RepID=A0ABY0HJS7_9PEZI|nr:hypothetical protein DL763_005928 [Monosporascus cannonballus]RYO95098.1 hypothetical protein DL762_000291 [Monosporascus cannonballus]RYP11647.1 hypothetical protein DL766_010023 [Monosporascus sp. MC13-8B]